MENEDKRHEIPATVQLIIEKEGKILMIKRANTRYGNGNYALPGGHVEKGEDLKTAMIREAKEEVGIIVNREDLVLEKVVHDGIKPNGYLGFLFRIKVWEGTITNAEPKKCDELIWVEENQLPENTLSFLKEAWREKSNYFAYRWEENE